ncbi:hypothetical protein XI08_18115 [Bradyrhizobium sp. CCBAU 11361]|nr:hypothetical protein [Bradyrhizobium sp. CCBAU 11361]
MVGNICASKVACDYGPSALEYQAFGSRFLRSFGFVCLRPHWTVAMGIADDFADQNRKFACLRQDRMGPPRCEV